MCFCVGLVFFFKQKTAYEMRISDWSSDVCSSDLTGGGVIVAACGEGGLDGTQPASVTSSNIDSSDCFIEAPLAPGRPGCPLLLPQIGRASCRGRGCQYV